jgi:NAD(P)H dehydrogenase (quinone)
MAMAHSPQTFVTGATGQLGRLVINALLKRMPASGIVAGVRSADHDIAKRLALQGVTVRVADYTRPETLAAAFEGVGRLLLISSNAIGQRTAQHRHVIEAAKTAGVGLLAYTSLLHADSSPLALGETHRRTEAMVKASGLPFALLRHGWYTENHIASIPSALEYGAVLGSAGAGRFSSATRADLAEAAAVVLTTEGHGDRVYELAGDESYALTDLAAVIATTSGKPVTYNDMPKADFKRALIGMGLAETMAELIADSDLGASKGGLEDHGRQLSALIGRPTTPYRQALAAAIPAGGS